MGCTSLEKTKNMMGLQKIKGTEVGCSNFCTFNTVKHETKDLMLHVFKLYVLDNIYQYNVMCQCFVLMWYLIHLIPFILRLWPSCLHPWPHSVTLLSLAADTFKMDMQTWERLSAIALLQRPPPQVAMRRLTQSTLSPMCFIDREFSMNRGHFHAKPNYCFVIFVFFLFSFFNYVGMTYSKLHIRSIE